MGSEFTFYEYVDSGGRSFVGPWLRNDVSATVRAKFHKWMLNLEGMPLAMWSMPMVKPVGGGLFQLRTHGQSRQQYRILFTHTPNQRPTLLHGFFKPDKKLPPGDRAVAQARRVALLANRDEHQVEYRYD